MPGNGIRLGRIGALDTSETPILLLRIQVYTLCHQRQMGLYAERFRIYLPHLATLVANHLHHLLSHRSPLRRLLPRHCFTAGTARQDPTLREPTRYHHPQIPYTYYYLLQGMMPMLTTITLVPLTKTWHVR
jgi:hypothetical protein